MRHTGMLAWGVVLVGLATACGGRDVTLAVGPAADRADRRAYDGAPPVVPHDASLAACTSCHDEDGSVIPGIGVAPASPHGADAAAGGMARCRQCHVPAVTRSELVSSRFRGLPQAMSRGERATLGAPPTIPHPLELRRRCLACHGGPAARVEIRTTHPERVRCEQCHVPESKT